MFSVFGFGFKNNYFAKMSTGFEEGSYLRRIDIVSLNSRLESNKEREIAYGLRFWGCGLAIVVRGFGRP